MNNIVVYVHGKGGSAEETAHYKALFPDSEVIGFDYLAQTPREAREEFPPFFAGLRSPQRSEKRCRGGISAMCGSIRFRGASQHVFCTESGTI